MKRSRSRIVCALLLGFSFAVTCVSASADEYGRRDQQGQNERAERHDHDTVLQGRQTFRFDTFGDEDFWGGTLKLHQAIEGSAFGGVGAGVSPKTALAVGLKVDVDALPASVLNALRSGKVNLDDPAVTLTLLKLNAVVGVTGFFQSGLSLKSIGIQCALCHSTVDNSFAPGIGHRLDGWANRDLNVGAIVSLAPDLSAVAEPDRYKKALERAGFAVTAERNRRDFALAFFADLRAKTAAAGGPPPLGLHVLMGKTTPEKVQNMIDNISKGRIAPVELIARKL